MSETKLGIKIGFGFTLIVLSVFVVMVATPDVETTRMDNLTTFSWGHNPKYDLNITAPEGPTHYTVQLGSNYIYLGEEYYDLHEIPENGVITVTRTGNHLVQICFWIREADNYYTLVGMGVYE